MSLKCIYIFAVTFSKMEKFVKFIILQKFYKYVQYIQFGVPQQYAATHRRVKEKQGRHDQ